LSPQSSQLELPCYYGDYIIQGVGKLKKRDGRRHLSEMRNGEWRLRQADKGVLCPMRVWEVFI
jgi:hypothetical protein